MDRLIYRLLVSYDGSRFNGFQAQPSQDVVTVQGEIENVLSKLFAEPIHISCAGRTDAGVHALGQMISFKASHKRDLATLYRATNMLLPQDIKVRQCGLAPNEFHARFSALTRTYEYVMRLEERFEPLFRRREPLFRQRFPSVPHDIDVDKMNAAAKLLLGHTDFVSYGAQIEKGMSTVRDLQELRVDKRTLSCGDSPLPSCLQHCQQLLVVTVRANGFLHRMVRLLVASLVSVGLGEWAIDEPLRVREAHQTGLCPRAMPSGGLYFVKVDYPPEMLEGSWYPETP